MADDSTAAKVYAEYVDGLLAAEQEQRAAIQARGASVITVSGGVVTLLLGLAALVTGRGGPVLPAATRLFLLLAMASFLFAAVLAIGIYAPRLQVVVDPEATKAELRRRWSDAESVGLAKVTADRLAWLARLQTANDTRALVLLAAIVMQVLAVLLVGIALAVILW